MITEEEVKYAEAALTRYTDSEIKFDAFTVIAAAQCSSAKGSNWNYLRHWRFEHTAIKANTIKMSKRLDHPNYVTNQNRALADDKCSENSKLIKSGKTNLSSTRQMT
jgi:hypothetical protein